MLHCDDRRGYVDDAGFARREPRRGGRPFGGAANCSGRQHGEQRCGQRQRCRFESCMCRTGSLLPGAVDHLPSSRTQDLLRLRAARADRARRESALYVLPGRDFGLPAGVLHGRTDGLLPSRLFGPRRGDLRMVLRLQRRCPLFALWRDCRRHAWSLERNWHPFNGRGHALSV